MTSKRLYKVTLTGWVVKDESQAEVTEWSFDDIIGEIVGEQLMVNFIDSNDMIVTPTRSDVEKHKEIAKVYGAGDERLKLPRFTQIDPAQDGINAVTEDMLAADKALGELVVQSYEQERSAADDSDELPPLIMDFEGDDEEVDDSEMSL